MITNLNLFIVSNIIGVKNLEVFILIPLIHLRSISGNNINTSKFFISMRYNTLSTFLILNSPRINNINLNFL